MGKSIYILLITMSEYRYGIAPRLSSMNGDQPRIEVLNPCDDGDDQKTPTTILFSNDGEFLGEYFHV